MLQEAPQRIVLSMKMPGILPKIIQRTVSSMTMLCFLGAGRTLRHGPVHREMFNSRCQQMLCQMAKPLWPWQSVLLCKNLREHQVHTRDLHQELNPWKELLHLSVGVTLKEDSAVGGRSWNFSHLLPLQGTIMAHGCRKCQLRYQFILSIKSIIQDEIALL